MKASLWQRIIFLVWKQRKNTSSSSIFSFSWVFFFERKCNLFKPLFFPATENKERSEFHWHLSCHHVGPDTSVQWYQFPQFWHSPAPIPFPITWCQHSLQEAPILSIKSWNMSKQTVLLPWMKMNENDKTVVWSNRCAAAVVLQGCGFCHATSCRVDWKTSVLNKKYVNKATTTTSVTPRLMLHSFATHSGLLCYFKHLTDKLGICVPACDHPVPEVENQE